MLRRLWMVAVAGVATAVVACSAAPASHRGFSEDGGASDAAVSDAGDCNPFDPASWCYSRPASSTDAGAVDAGSCKPKNTCFGARDIGRIQGDGKRNPLIVKGTGAEFLRLRVFEGDSAYIGIPMKVSLKFESGSATADPDIYVYLDPTADNTPECTAVFASATTSAGVEHVELVWGEVTAPNGSNDDRWAIIEVRIPNSTTGSSPCNTSWILRVE